MLDPNQRAARDRGLQVLDCCCLADEVVLDGQCWGLQMLCWCLACCCCLLGDGAFADDGGAASAIGVVHAFNNKAD